MVKQAFVLVARVVFVYLVFAKRTQTNLVLEAGDGIESSKSDSLSFCEILRASTLQSAFLQVKASWWLPSHFRLSSRLSPSFFRSRTVRI